MSYPNEPGFVAGNQSSEEAAASVKESAASIRNKIWRYVADSPGGKTCDELEAELYLSHQTASARCTELKSLGRFAPLKDEITGEKIRRKTRSGRNADVHISVATPS